MANPLLMAEIFDNINEGIYILNRKGDYIYCNNAFLKMVGATREEALSLNAFQLIPEGQVSVSVAVTAFTEKKKVSVVNNVLTPKGYHYRQLAHGTPYLRQRRRGGVYVGRDRPAGSAGQAVSAGYPL